MIRKNFAMPTRFLPVLAFLLASCDLATTPPPTPVGPGTLNVADAAIAGGDPALALSISQSVLAADPGSPPALVHEGDAYYALGRCPAASAAYQLALRTDPRSAPAQTGLARCLLKTDPRAAEAALLVAVQSDPGNAAAYNDLGVARDLQDNFTGAADAYRHALLADPAMTAAEVNLGLSLALAGDGASALEYLGPLATGQGATPKIREDYAAALIAAGRPTEARAVLAVDLAPDQVNQAMAGFNALIAGDQPPLNLMPPPPPPTTLTLPPASPVSSTTLPPPAPHEL